MREKSITKAIVLLSVAVALVSCAQPVGVDPAGGTSYDRIVARGSVKAAYISYPPSFHRDPNTGEFGGIFHEVLLRATESMGLRLEYVEEVAWGSMIETLEAGRADVVVAGIWPTAARGLRADFTDPIYYSPVVAYCRESDNRFDGDLRGANTSDIRIAAIDGEMTSIIAATDFPDSSLMTLPQTSGVSQVLLEVATGKADLTFVEPAVALAFIAENPGRIRAVDGVPPLRIFPNVMMIGKGEVELGSTLNTAFEELVNTGFVSRVLDRYQEFPESLIRRKPIGEF